MLITYSPVDAQGTAPGWITSTKAYLLSHQYESKVQAACFFCALVYCMYLVYVYHTTMYCCIWHGVWLLCILLVFELAHQWRMGIIAVTAAAFHSWNCLPAFAYFMEVIILIVLSSQTRQPHIMQCAVLPPLSHTLFWFRIRDDANPFHFTVFFLEIACMCRWWGWGC